MVTGRPSIASKMPSKSARWSFSSSSSAASSSAASSARMNRCTSGSRSPRNMCSVRHSPMPSAPNLRATCASCGRSALVRTFSRRNSSAHRRITSNGPLGSGVTTGTAPTTTSPVVPLIEITSPSRTVAPFTWNTRAVDVDVELVRAAHRRRAHAARDHRRVAHEPAARREDALRRDHPVEVVGRRLGAHEDHAPRPRCVARLGVVGGEVDLADRGARRRVEALRDRGVLRRRVELRVQELVELRRARRAARPRACR